MAFTYALVCTHCTQFEPAYQAGGIVDRIHFQIRHKRLQLRKAAKQVINIGEVVSGIEQNTKFDSELNRWKYLELSRLLKNGNH